MVKSNKTYNRILFNIFIIILWGFLSACQDDFNDIINSENRSSNDNYTSDNNDSDNNDSDNNWIRLGNPATPRAGAAVSYYNGWIYIYGGEDYYGILNDFWRYETGTQNYEILPSDDPKAYADFAEIDGRLYLFGGKDVNDDPSDELKYFDISGNQWVEISGSGTTGSWPKARYSHVSLSYNNSVTGEKKIFIQGGFDSDGNVEGALHELDLLADPKPDWNKKTFNLGRGEHSAVIHNNRIYFFGGFDAAENQYMNDFYEYNIDLDSSVEMNTPPVSSRSAARCLVSGDYNLYIFGGKNDSEFFNDLWTYSFQNSSWENISEGPGPRCHYSAVQVNGSIIIFGGYYLNSSGKKLFNSELWSYTP